MLYGPYLEAGEVVGVAASAHDDDGRGERADAGQLFEPLTCLLRRQCGRFRGIGLAVQGGSGDGHEPGPADRAEAGHRAGVGQARRRRQAGHLASCDVRDGSGVLREGRAHAPGLGRGSPGSQDADTAAS
jgi:hypothetical protein